QSRVLPVADLADRSSLQRGEKLQRFAITPRVVLAIQIARVEAQRRFLQAHRQAPVERHFPVGAHAACSLPAPAPFSPMAANPARPTPARLSVSTKLGSRNILYSRRRD